MLSKISISLSALSLDQRWRIWHGIDITSRDALRLPVLSIAGYDGAPDYTRDRCSPAAERTGNAQISEDAVMSIATILIGKQIENRKMSPKPCLAMCDCAAPVWPKAQ